MAPRAKKTEAKTEPVEEAKPPVKSSATASLAPGSTFALRLAARKNAQA